jgi:hypothetical protein
MPNTLLDLHIHSALSPCAADDMVPPEVLLTAERRGLGVVGIVDHSTGRNGWAFLEAAEAFAVQVLVGIEVESAEGVHILALFDAAGPLEAFDALMAEILPAARNDPDVVGPQHLLDSWGRILGEEERLLITAVDVGLEDLAGLIATYGGLSVAAHVDRTAYGLLPVLGFIPPTLKVDLLEVSWRMTREEAVQRWPDLRGRPLIRGSDAHALEDIGQGSVRVDGLPPLVPGELRAWGAALAEAVRMHDA